MKLYKGLVEATVWALEDIFFKNRQADKVVERLFKTNKKWGSRDRSFIASNTYELVRWWRLVCYCADLENPSSDHLWRIFAVWQIIKPTHLKTDGDGILPEWEEFVGTETVAARNRYMEALTIRKIAQSIPDWLDEVGAEEIGETWDHELPALNNEAPLFLRVNTLKTDADTVRQIFGSEASSVTGVPDALMLNRRQNVSIRDSFKMGYFEVQDAGSQLIAPFLDVQPGHTVIDACAGAGGKTLHLASLMHNEGSILAMDVEYRKLEELMSRAKRGGVKILKTNWIDSPRVITDLAETADRVLLDVPCSGLGVMRRNPDTKWKLRPAFLDSIRQVQWDILNRYSQMVKVGGKMVYATCSILPSESENQVERFVSEYGSEWRLLKQHRTSTHSDGFDGFYMALLERF